MSTHRVGEKVRHVKKPEWGVGSVTKVETVTRQGARDQRLWIRFANGGLKTVLSSMAELEPADGPAAAVATGGDTFAAREARHEGGWLGEIAKRQPEEGMTSLPAAASDPFLAVERRLGFILDLYRFEPVGGKLIDWAVAQSGLDDPLSRFNRHELEKFFERWAHDRDVALHRTMQECRRNFMNVDAILARAPASAQRALKKHVLLR
jgi:hypothetical protein